jgi:hypothetical protein
MDRRIKPGDDAEIAARHGTTTMFAEAEPDSRGTGPDMASQQLRPLGSVLIHFLRIEGRGVIVGHNLAI